MIAALALAAALDLAHYRSRLEQIDVLLARGETARAAAEARDLQGSTIRAGDAEIAADAWTLGPIARREPHRARLRALLQSLDAEAQPARAPDGALLEELRRAQAPSVLAAGGEIDPLDLPGRSLRETIAEWGFKALRAIGRALVRLIEWLGELFPRPGGAGGSSGGGITTAVLIVVGMILALLAGVALLSFGRGRRSLAAPVRRAGRAEDEDPSSRTVSGWEQRAQELAAQGRHREAIRAWYHAVLARCAAAGVLHLRRGRTNWEYAFALAPSLPWREGFEDLTRRFDVEWYGRAESTGEALAAFADGAGGILRALGSRA